MREYTPSRRSLVRSIGATTLAAGLAGCSGSESESVSIDAGIDIVDADDQRFLECALSVTPTDEVERVLVMVNHAAEAEIREATDQMELTVPIRGGRHYSVEVVAHKGGVDANTVRQEIEMGYIPRADVPLHGDRTLCAHYYPWYGDEDSTQDWTDRSPSTPLLGEYESQDAETIEKHLEWCEKARINWLSTSWWGPDTFTDETLLDHVFEIDKAQEFTWSVLYETLGRYEEFPIDMSQEQPRNRLAADLQYLETNYFEKPWYHTIDGRPVVYIYTGFEFDGDVTGAWEEAVTGINSDPYLIADVGNTAVPDVLPIVEPADAITTYNPYRARDDIADVYRDVTKSMYRQWFLGRETTDVDIMPTAIPGYNDSVIRDNPVLEPSHELYDWNIRTARKYATGHDTIFITSFNEWYEDTQIEPTEQEEEKLLHVSDDILSEEEYEYPNFDGKILTLEFSRSVPEKEIVPDPDSDRELTCYCENLTVRHPQDDVLDSYNIGSEEEPLILSGSYAPQTNSDSTGRWFGGDTTTSMYLNGLTTRYTIQLTGRASAEMTATAYYNGEKVGTGSIGEKIDTYELR